LIGKRRGRRCEGGVIREEVSGGVLSEVLGVFSELGVLEAKPPIRRKKKDEAEGSGLGDG